MHSITKVKQLRFSDLYLGHPLLGDMFSDVPGADVNPLPANTALHEDLMQLHAVCKEAIDGISSMSDLKVRYDGVAYRASVMRTMGGEVFVLRKIADSIFSLAETGIPQAYIRHLMARDLSGLFIISGAIKAGKTSTACALIKERLIAYGGVAVTAEDPIELPLEGNYGHGVCYQTHVKHEKGGFVEAFRHVVRWGARIIFIGEIRDPDVAVEVLQASLNGHLVISTVTAENVVQTITKLHALASEKLASGNAQTMLADGLAGVLHQQMDISTRKKMETECLFLRDAAQALKTAMRNGNYDALNAEIRYQMSSMIASNAIAQRHANA